MASEAFVNVQKSMDAERERELAAYIMRDVELRKQNAEERGVLAYGKRPIPRSTVNQRFLQNTLKSVDFGNRVARENEMWDKWEGKKRPGDPAEDEGRKSKQKKHKRGKKRRRDEEEARLEDREASSGSETSKGDADLQEFLTRKAPRGRGSTGPRAEETGPFLFPTDEQEREEYEMMRYVKRPPAGAECPGWIRQQNGSHGEEGGARRNALEESTALLGSKQERKESNKTKRKSKASKKEHKKKRRKEKGSP